MQKPENHDFIELWVEDDGEIVLCKRPEEYEIFPPIKNLCYSILEMESLAIELHSYGVEKTAIQKAILKVCFENYNEPVRV
jgi:hypothetical protein